jgi:general secretion pathway protein G
MVKLIMRYPESLPVSSGGIATNHRRPRGLSGGFTLIELVIVMAIIALLAALVGPRLFGQLSDSRVKITRAQVELLATALDSFRLDIGRYPAQSEGLEALVTKPEGLETWSGPYLRKRQLPKDAWQREFVYAVPASLGGIEYDLYSFGADGQLGGEGEDADVGNW